MSGKVHFIFNPGSTHSKGTAILINKNISTSLQVVNITHKSDDGRILLINTCIDDKEFCFINIYAPNNQSERKLFFFKNSKMDLKILNKQ